ncbi:FAD-dependent oxidoreductase [Bacteroides salyersiae]|uniref:FAD-dependent oxidoreductase n=1 Tax=Bacteroides salyersiae TaxID=291644 RepID=UPI001C8B3E48|nr:FAD-dependent oxidoreductase [Bacteroides salyersiae]
MDRRKFVKSIGLLGGAVLSGAPVARVLAGEKSERGNSNGDYKNYDVIVIGGGTSGCAAAMAAAREGARTLLIEATNVLGGMGTSGLIPTWVPFSGREMLYGGIAEKVFRSLYKESDYQRIGLLDGLPVDAEALKRVYDEMLAGAEVEVLFNSRVVEVKNKTGKKVESVLVASDSGLATYKGDFFIDCTGNARAAAWAGAQLQEIDDRQKTEDAGFCFLLGNVDFYSYTYQFQKKTKATAELIKTIVRSGKYPLLQESHFENRLMNSSVVKFRASPVCQIAPNSRQTYTEGLFRGRAIAQQVLQALKEYFPETFAAAVLINSATQLDLPVPSRILGDYVFTKSDFELRKSFDDEIGRNDYSSYHKLVYKKGESHGIPYRILTPLGLRNLLVAGKAVSVDKDICGSLGTIPACLTTGEAAGMATGLLLKMKKRDVHTIDIPLLQNRLKEERQNI